MIGFTPILQHVRRSLRNNAENGPRARSLQQTSHRFVDGTVSSGDQDRLGVRRASDFADMPRAMALDDLDAAIMAAQSFGDEIDCVPVVPAGAGVRDHDNSPRELA